MAITISGENNNDKILASDGVIDQISGINIVGLLTAGHLNVGSNIQLGNAGVITATTFNGNVTGNINNTSPLLLQTGGSERFRITGNNELGIAGANYGTSGQVLTSGGSGNAVTWSTITSTTINNNGNNRLITGSGTANTLEGESTITYDNPTLEINTDTSPYASLTLNGNTGGLIQFEDNETSKWQIFGTTDLNFYDDVNNASRLRITSSGTIGVGGTSIPGALLDLSSSQPGILFSETGVSANNGKWLNQANASELYWQAQTDAHSGGGNLFKMTRSAQQIQSFEGQQSGATWFTVRNSDKKVGIGTDNPDQILEVFKASGTNLVKVTSQANSTVGLEIEKTGATTQSWRIADGQTVNGALEFYDVTDSRRAMGIDGSGRVIIGPGNHAGGSQLVIKGGGTNTYSTLGMFSNHTNPANNTLLSQIRFGSNATAVGADIRVYADADWGSNDYPTRMSFYTTDDGTNGRDERLRIDNAGRVMINQTTNLAGTAKLEVMGTGDNSYPQYSYAIGICDTQAYNVSNGTGMGIGFSYKHNSAGATALGCGIRGFKENTTDGNYAGAMAFYTRANGAGAGERGRFSSAGTFGVGTANPDSNYKIDCNGKLRIGDGNAGHRIQFSRSGLGDELVLGVDGYGSSTNNEAVIQSSINSSRPLVLRTGDGDRLRIAANGRVGIWETETKIGTFAESLQVRGLYGNQYAIAAKINQSSGSLMRFSTKNPTNGNDDLCGSITGNGTSSSFNTSSDYRLKENDVIITDGITRIKQLRPIRFNWKTDSSSTQDGFFAHEVQPIVPESVIGEKDAPIDSIGEGYQQIDHSKLVPLLTAALQEAITEIETLKTKVAALESS